MTQAAAGAGRTCASRTARRWRRPRAVWEAVESESAALEGEGRVLVRPSGTEPVVRVMVEAPTQERCEAVCARVVEVVERELGPRR